MNVVARIRGWLAPPTFENDEQKNNAAVVLNVLLLVLFAALGLYLTVAIISRTGVQLVVFMIGLALLATCAASFILLRRGQVRLAGTIVSLIFWVGFTVGAFAFSGLYDESVLGFFVVVVMASIVLGPAGLVVFTTLSVLSVVALYVTERIGLFVPVMDFPAQINDLALIVLMIALSATMLGYHVQRMAALYATARRGAVALAESNAELEASRDVLTEQSLKLERRARYLEVTAAAAREATLELGGTELLTRMARLVSDQLGFYHVGIFFLEPDGEWLALQAASSEGGQRMLARGHRLRMGQGVVGYAADHRRYQVLMDVGKDEPGEGTAQTIYFDNPDLPATRSEAALPLVARGSLIGVLDVQSTEPNAFGEEDLLALQVLANQWAVVISNARLYYEAQLAMEAQREAYGDLSRQAWQELFRLQPELTIVRTERGLAPTRARPDEELRQALKTGKPVVGSGDQPGQDAVGLALPIRVRGAGGSQVVIGAIDAHKPAGGGEWTAEQRALMEAVCEQLADALDDARMYRDARRRAARERVLAEVAGRVRESLDVDVVLRRAVQEMRQALGVAEVEVRLDLVDQPAAERQPAESAHRGAGS